MREYKTKKEWLERNFGSGLLTHDEPMTEFYYKALHDYNMGVSDADDYAWLNTLFGYDIGADNAMEIIRWYYENLDTTVMESVDIHQKEMLANLLDEFGFHLDFSQWPTEEPQFLRYEFDPI